VRNRITPKYISLLDSDNSSPKIISKQQMPMINTMGNSSAVNSGER
jgi:hypothetical protein